MNANVGSSFTDSEEADFLDRDMHAPRLELGVDLEQFRNQGVLSVRRGGFGHARPCRLCGRIHGRLAVAPGEGCEQRYSGGLE
jgi:hypothetical protein